MHPTSRSIISFLAGVLTLLILVWSTVLTPPEPEAVLSSFVFLLLLLIMSLAGVPLGGGTASFLPMTTIAAFLVVGLVPAGWIAFTCELLAPCLEQIQFTRAGRARQEKFFDTFSRAAANAAIQPASILFAGAVYLWMGGLLPLRTVQPDLVWPLFVLAISYLLINYGLAGLFFISRGRESLSQYLQAIPGLLAYEGVPILFAPLMALLYGRIGIASFGVFSVAMVASALIMRNLAQARLRLERRVRELDSLHAIGKAVSSSLELNIILETIYQQIRRLMPAENFYIALYDRETDQVSFPFVIEEGTRIQAKSRYTGGGLTEYILKNRSPVLAVESTNTIRQLLGLSPSKRPAVSWVGVPIIAADETLGVIALQSYKSVGIYDQAHQSVLGAIADQAAIAIKNARLYARTDEALAWRLQQLSSILEATHDGILLLNIGGHVITVNPAFAALVGVRLDDLLLASVNTRLGSDQLTIVQQLGYSEDELSKDLGDIIGGEEEFLKQSIVIPGTGIHAERTLQPVRDEAGAVASWLFVLRDMSEEVKLEHLRDDLVQMIIHDLRAPLTIIQNGSEAVRTSILSGQLENASNLLDMITKSTSRMLSLINQMLDIRQMESAEVELNLQPISVRLLIQDLLEQFSPAILDADIQVNLQLPETLPDIKVDPEHARRIFSNLLDNSIKFTPDGGRIDVNAERSPSRLKSELIISIKDTGPGISAEMMPHMFEKLKINSSQVARRKGSGLGLYYCKLAVEAHLGRIWVESEEGQGSAFIVALPAV
jgi:two-component system, NtrC family, sensor histidine kinase KinB